MLKDHALTLYYIHDPMCSWCWGFSRTWKAIQSALPSHITLEYVLGGLAPDSDEPMPIETQRYVQSNWRRIQEKIPGVEFNNEFWSKCQPKRSTYPACRSVLAAKAQGAQYECSMIEAIQHAYYLQARNPSEEETLIALSSEIGLDVDRFVSDMHSEHIHHQLNENIHFYHDLSLKTGIKGFPSLALKKENDWYAVPIDYNNECVSLDVIKTVGKM